MSQNLKIFSLGKSLRHAGRLAQITNVFAKHGFLTVIDRIGIEKWLHKKPKKNKKNNPLQSETPSLSIEASRDLPIRLRKAFEELGPAFVKLGQILATRKDLFPKDLIRELQRLHQKVEPLPYKTISKVLQNELSDDIAVIFSQVQEECLAAGSIGQVHEAKLPSGEEIVIKIQRPGIYDVIKTDCEIITGIARLIEKFIPETKVFRPVRLASDFHQKTMAELDFIKEASNAVKFTRNFENTPSIIIPKIYWEHTSQRVLVMEKFNGKPVAEAGSIQKDSETAHSLVKNGLEMFLQMVFIDGVFHGDLHPGNLLVLADQKIGVIDFGNAVRLTKYTRESLAGLLLALVKEDYESIVHNFTELSDADHYFDPAAFESDLIQIISPYLGVDIKYVNTGKLLWDLASIAAKHNAPLKTELVSFIRTLITFESIAKDLTPEFKVLEACEQYATKISQQFYSPEAMKQEFMVLGRDTAKLARYAPMQFRRILKATADGQLKVAIEADALNAVAKAIKNTGSIIGVSLIIAALLIGSSILTFGKVKLQYLSISTFGILGFAIAGVLGLYVIWSVLRNR